MPKLVRNLNIEAELHEAAKKKARAKGISYSSYVCGLIMADMPDFKFTEGESAEADDDPPEPSAAETQRELLAEAKRLLDHASKLGASTSHVAQKSSQGAPKQKPAGKK